MEKQELALEERFRFLARVYFGDINDLFNVAGNRAFRDFSITIKYNTNISDQVKDQKKSEINQMIGEGLTGIKKEEYDSWHNNMCNKIVDIFKPLVHSFSYGQAQKWVNMMAKYLLTLKYDEFKHLIPFLHIPIDNVVLDLAVKSLGISKPKKKWSQWDENQYTTYQNNLREKITEENPIIWEYRNWGIYNTERTSKRLAKKNDKPIDNPIPVLYKMKAKDGGHYVLEEEQFTFNGAPISLILCRRSGGKSHFCGFWNKDVPNTNIDSISEIQDIIKELSLSLLKWQNKPEYSRKYVMYTSKDSYKKAKELKDKISEFIHNMNR